MTERGLTKKERRRESASGRKADRETREREKREREGER